MQTRFFWHQSFGVFDRKPAGLQSLAYDRTPPAASRICIHGDTKTVSDGVWGEFLLYFCRSTALNFGQQLHSLVSCGKTTCFGVSVVFFLPVAPAETERASAPVPDPAWSCARPLWVSSWWGTAFKMHHLSDSMESKLSPANPYTMEYTSWNLLHQISVLGLSMAGSKR